MGLRQAGRSFKSFFAPIGKIKKKLNRLFDIVLKEWIWCFTVNHLIFWSLSALGLRGLSKLNEGSREWHSIDQTTCPIVNWYHMTAGNVYFCFQSLTGRAFYLKGYRQNLYPTWVHVVFNVRGIFNWSRENTAQGKSCSFFLFNPPHYVGDWLAWV